MPGRGPGKVRGGDRRDGAPQLAVPGHGVRCRDRRALPWREGGQEIVGRFAARRGVETLGRLVTSAKSWLSYTAADRTAPILPPDAQEGAPRVSPVDASRPCSLNESDCSASLPMLL